MKRPKDPQSPASASGKPRQPVSFALDVEDKTNASTPEGAMARAPRSFNGSIDIVPDERDPFIAGTDEPSPPEAAPRTRRFSFAKLALGAFSLLLSLALGLWTDQLIRDLFARADWLGYTALAAAFVGLAAVFALILREGLGLYRLEAVQSLKTEAQAAVGSRLRPPAQKVVDKLVSLVRHRAQTARGVAALTALKDDVIDGPQLIELAERELLSPLDAEARNLILASAKRVSVVTAVSPRAIVDLAYVVFEVMKLIRAIADLYGGRPGSLGMLRLLRDVIAHLAVTGSIAVGDNIAQQVLGHGLAARLSTRLGEGVINGLMTARIGIAATDLCRPLPFRACKRPGIGDFISDLTPSVTGRSRGQTT